MKASESSDMKLTLTHPSQNRVGGLDDQGGTIHQNPTHSDAHFAVAPFILLPFHPKNHTQETAF